jgi:molybdate transport system ATP-binding protein
MTLSIAIKHAFPRFALNAEVEAPAGVTVLFGRSGSGKTSLVNAVAGLLKPQQGRIAVNGRVLCDTARGLWLPPHRRHLGYIFQEGRLFPHLSVRSNLVYGRWFAGKRGAGPDIDRVVEMLSIGHLLDRRPGTLSGGEKQRVAIGRALLADPALILADEPLASLDEARKEEILPYFERLRDEVEVPILYVSHSASEVARLATTVVVIHEGRVARQGPASEILGDPSVTPLGAREAGAVLDSRVAAQHSDGLTELEAGGQRLFLPRVAHDVGAKLRVRISADDVILARSRPEGLSELNVLAAVVHEIRYGEGPGALVALDSAAGRLLARITRRSVAALALAPGSACYAVVKTISVPALDIGYAAEARPTAVG